MKRLRLCVCVLTCCLATYAAPVSGSNPPGPHNQHGNEPVWEHNLFSAGYDPISFNGGTVSAIILEDGTERKITPQGEPQVEMTERPTPLGPAVQRTYSWTTVQGYRLEYRITRIGNDAFTLSAALTNGSLNPIRLERFWLLKTPENGMTVTGEPSDWMLSSTDPEARRWGTLDRRLPTERELLQEGAFCRNYLISGGDETKINDPAWRGFGDNMSLYHRSGRGVTFAAVDTVADVNFDIRVEGTQMRLDIWCDMTGVLVESGETRPSDEVLVAIRPWGAAMQARSRWIADVAGVRNTKKPVFGWCSWYRSKTDVTAEEVCSLADYVGKNRDRIPMEVVQIDEGWHRSRYDWRENGKFSMGMDSIARCIRKAGMVPGVWLCPVNPEVMPFEAGSPRRVFPAEWYINYGTGEPSMTRLDPTQPEARAHMRKVLQTLYDQGYRYFKLDFSYIPNDSRSFYNPKVTRLQAQRALFRLYREAIGEESYLMACCYQQRTIVPYADANRIGTDCCAEEGFCRPLASDGLPGNLWSPYFPILSMASSCYENGILGNSDPDVTYLAYTHKTKPAQLLTFHSFIGTLGGAVLTSDLLYLPEFDQPQNIRLFEILNPSAREKGVSFSGGFDPYGREFGCVVERSYGNSVNLLLWNPEHKQAADLTMTHVPLEKIGKRFHVWSLWDEAYLGIHGNDFHVPQVAPYEHKLLRLTALSEGPSLIGSNLYISMGATEVLSFERQQDKLQITLDPDAGARNGKLFIYSEEPLSQAVSTNSDVFVCKQQGTDHVYVVTLTDRVRERPETVTLRIGAGEAPGQQTVLKDKARAAKWDKASFSQGWLTAW